MKKNHGTTVIFAGLILIPRVVIQHVYIAIKKMNQGIGVEAAGHSILKKPILTLCVTSVDG